MAGLLDLLSSSGLLGPTYNPMTDVNPPPYAQPVYPMQGQPGGSTIDMSARGKTPQAMAPPLPQQMQPQQQPQTDLRGLPTGAGDNLTAGIMNMSASLRSGYGLIPALVNGIQGFSSGIRMDPQGVAQATMMANYKALLATGKYSEPQARLMAINSVMQNPKVQEQLFGAPTNMGSLKLPNGAEIPSYSMNGRAPVYNVPPQYADQISAVKGIALQPGGELVNPMMPSQSSNGQAQGSQGAQPTIKNTNGLFDKETLTQMADQYLTGDKSVLQNLGRSALGALNVTALRQRIVTRARELGISPTEIAGRVGQFDSYQSAQKATGTRGGNVTMAATEAGNLGNLVLDTSANVPRSNYPIWNRATNAYRENTGDPNIVKFTGALNSYINAYSRAINPTGSTTVSDKEHAREILDTAMAHGQIQGGIEQLQKELDQAKRAPSTSSDTIKREFMNNADPKNSDVLNQARDAISRGAPKDAVIQRLKKMGVDPGAL